MIQQQTDRSRKMSNKDIHLYVLFTDRLWSLNITRLLCSKGKGKGKGKGSGSGSKRPEFKLVYGNSNCEFPTGMGHIVLDSKLYLFGGENLRPRKHDADGPVSLLHNLTRSSDPEKHWASEDVFTYDFSSGRLCKDSSFPRMLGPKTMPIVATLGNKIYVLATKPLLGTVGALLPGVLFETLDLEERAWKPLNCPPFYADIKLRGLPNYPCYHYAWGSKLVVNMTHGSYIFDSDHGQWQSLQENYIPLPQLSAAVEYKGLLIGIPPNKQRVVAYNLGSFGEYSDFRILHDLNREIFSPPLEEHLKGCLIPLDDGGRLCLLQSGFDSSGDWCVRVAVFKVSVSGPSTSTAFPDFTTTLEAVDTHKFQNCILAVQSTFIMFEDLSKQDDNEADSNLSLLDSCGDSRKRAAESILDDAVGKRPEATFS